MNKYLRGIVHIQAFIKFSERWVEVTKNFFGVLGLGYLGIYTCQVVYKENLGLSQSLDTASGIVWFAFLVDLVFRIPAARSVPVFIKRNWLEILALSVPTIRAARVLRVLITLTSVRRLLSTRLQQTGAFIALALPIVWFAGGVAILDVESTSSNATILSLGSALWWSLTTITTVGYGDLYPVTLEGKFIAATLMLSGITLFSAGAGMFANWLMSEKVSDKGKS